MYRLAMIVLMGIVGVFSCTNAPFEPTADQSYKLYFWDEGDLKQYYSYDPVDDKLEAFWLPFRSVHAKVTPDGKSMWTLTSSGSVVVMDIVEQEVVHTIDSESYLEIVFSENGKYGALLGYDLAIVRLSDYSIIYSDSISCSGGVFTRDGNGFYYLAGRVFRLAINDDFAKVEFSFDSGTINAVTQVLPNADESSLYLAFRGGSGNLLAEYLPATDTLVGIEVLYPYQHKMALTKGEQYLFVTTEPPLIIQMYPPEFTYQVFETGTNETVVEQSVWMEIIPGDTIWASPIDLVITPDYKWAIMLIDSYEGTFVVVDLETMTIDHGYHLGFGHDFQSLSCSGYKQ